MRFLDLFRKSGSKRGYKCKECEKEIKGRIFRINVGKSKGDYCEKCWNKIDPNWKICRGSEFEEFMKKSKSTYQKPFVLEGYPFIVEIHCNKKLKKK